MAVRVEDLDALEAPAAPARALTVDLLDALDAPAPLPAMAVASPPPPLRAVVSLEPGRSMLVPEIPTAPVAPAGVTIEQLDSLDLVVPPAAAPSSVPATAPPVPPAPPSPRLTSPAALWRSVGTPWTAEMPAPPAVPTADILRPPRVREEPTLRAAPPPRFRPLETIGNVLGITSPEVTRQAEAARATAEVVARERGESPQQFREGMVGPQAPLERAAKGVQRGALGTAESLSGAVQWLEGVLGVKTPVGAAAEEVGAALRAKVEALQPSDPGFPDRLAEGVGSMAMFVIPGLGTEAAVARVATVAPRIARILGMSQATIMEALAEAGDSYRSLLERGMAPNEAARQAGKVFGQNVVLVGVTNRLGIFADAGSAVAKTAKSALLEGLQEGGQYDIQRRAAGDPFQPKEAAEAAAVGAIVGGGTGLAVRQLERRGTAPTPEAAPPPAAPPPARPRPPVRRPVPPPSPPLAEAPRFTPAPTVPRETDIAPQGPGASRIDEGAGPATSTTPPAAPAPQAPPVPAQPEAEIGGSAPAKPPLAPVQWLGWQTGVPGQAPIPFWNLTEAIPGHPAGSTLGPQDLEAAGYRAPEPPEPAPAADLLADERARARRAALLLGEAGINGRARIGDEVWVKTDERQDGEGWMRERDGATLRGSAIIDEAARAGWDVEKLETEQGERTPLYPPGPAPVPLVAEPAAPPAPPPPAPKAEVTSPPPPTRPVPGRVADVPRPETAPELQAGQTQGALVPVTPEESRRLVDQVEAFLEGNPLRDIIEEARTSGDRLDIETIDDNAPVRQEAERLRALVEQHLDGQQDPGLRADLEEQRAVLGGVIGALTPAGAQEPRVVPPAEVPKTPPPSRPVPGRPATAVPAGGFSATLYQGRGATPEQVYGKANVQAGRGHPLVGPGQYYAFTPQDAERYGEVSEHAVTLRNPYVLVGDRQWRDLLTAAKAGQLSSVDREQGPTEAAAQRLQDYLVAQGHDGLVTRFPSAAEGDIGETGQPIKRLRESFGASQVVVFGREAPPVPPSSAEPVGPTDATRDSLIERRVELEKIAKQHTAAGQPNRAAQAYATAQNIENELREKFGEAAVEEALRRAAAAPAATQDWEGLRREALALLDDVLAGQTTVPRIKARALLPRFENAPPDLIDLRRRIADLAEGAAEPPTPPAPARPGAYPHAERFGKLTTAFEAALRANTLPKDPRKLRQMAAQAAGLTERDFGQDAAAVDDLFDAIEVAINRVYRERRNPALPLAEQLQRAVAVEGYLGNRVRTLELSKRQQFSTPLPLAEGAAYALDPRPGETIVEPTAGTGNLLAPLPREAVILANEIDPRRAEGLRLQGYDVRQEDALRVELPGSVSVMNPPWGKYSAQKYGPAIPMPYGESVDVAERFVVKALRELPEGARVAAVMPTTILQSHAFLRWLQDKHTLRALIQSPPEAYTTRGTTVDSVLLVVDKGRVPDAPAALRATPATWEDYARAVEPLAAGNSHARAVSAGVIPVVRSGPASQLPSGSTGVPGAPGAVRPSAEAGGAQAPEAPAASEGAAPAGEPGRQPQAAPRPVPGRPATGAPGPDATVVAPSGGRGGPERGGAGAGLPGQPRGGLAVRAEGQRFSYADQGEFDAASRSSVFAPAPLRSAPGTNPHPRLIVTTRSLAGAKLPPLTYQPQGRLLPDAYARKVISDAQWDYGILPALQAKGFLAAADVGVGKTRVAAAVAGEWLETGTKRVLYVTASEVNIQDVKREFDLYAGGAWPFEILEVKSFKGASERSRGEYSPLPHQDGTVYIIDRFNVVAYQRALREVGFDAIIGDEAHLLKNIEGAKVGEAWFTIQKQTLNQGGKFLYLTATPAVDFDDLQHMIGLREWRPDGFEDYKERVTGTKPPESAGDLQARETALRDRLYGIVRQAGEEGAWTAWMREHLGEPKPFMKAEDRRDLLEQNIAALEAELARRGASDTAQAGSDAENVGVRAQGGRKGFLRGGDPFGLHITPAEQEQIMRELAMKGKYYSVDLWRAGVEFDIATHPLTPEQAAEYDRLAVFFRDLNREFMRWGRLNKGRRRMLTIRHFLQQEAKSRMFDYRLDEAIRLAKEALARGEQPVISTIRVNEGRPDEGSIPAAINTINARLVEVDESGEIVTDEEIPEALVVRAELLDRWQEFRQTRDPVALMLEAFGKEHVAVITGAVQPKTREKAIKEFQEGQRQVAMISGAGKTGISLHHILDTTGDAKGRRHLIVTDFEWSATTFKQELGRVDRSGQRSAPKVTVLSTGAAGEKKFLATIANRMRNLGALSKGSAESASNDKLAEFEISGNLDTHAMRLAYRGLPEDIQAQFIASVWRDSNSFDPATGSYRNTRSYPQGASLKDFLLDLQFMDPASADRAFDAFWQERTRLIHAQEQAEEGRETAQRTRTNEGTIRRSTALSETLTLHEVEDTHGHHFGILQGLITDHMPKLSRSLPTGAAGAPIRRYITFKAGDDQVAGLEIRRGAIRPLAQQFGQRLGGALDSPAAVLEALKAGDRVPLHGEGGYVLRMRPSDKLIQIEGAKMAQKDALLRYGAKYVPAGNVWHVPSDKLADFLDRWPVKDTAGPRSGNTADEVTRQHLREVHEQQEADREQAAGDDVGLVFLPGVGRLFRRSAPGRPTAPPSPLAASDPDVETALTSTADRSRLTGLGAKLRDAFRRVQRAVIFEMGLRGFPLERDETRVFLGSARRRALLGAGQDITGVKGRLRNPQEEEHFDRIVLLLSYQSRLSDPDRFPGGVPHGLTLDQVEPELERLQQSAPPTVREAVEAHVRLMTAEADDLEARGLLPAERRIDNYLPHHVLPLEEAEEARPLPNAPRRLQRPFRRYLQRARGSEREMETDYTRIMYEHRASVRYANAVDDFAQTILERHDRRGDLSEETRRALQPGQRVDAAGEPHRAIQYVPPRMARVVFPVQTVPEEALADAMLRGAEILEIPVEDLRVRLALGRYRRIYVVPEAIADRFEIFAPPPVADLVKLANDGTRLWKRTTVGFWGQSGNVLNLMGDLINIVRVPATWAHVIPAAREVLRWTAGKPSDLLELMERYDVPSSGFVGSELDYRLKAPEMRQLLTATQRMKQVALDRVLGLVLGGAAGYKGGGIPGALVGGSLGAMIGARHYFETLPQIRETIPRAAVARYQLRRLERGLPLRPGPVDITGLEGERAVMKIARELPMDYGRMTPDERRYLTGLLLPFYAWPILNFTSWLRFLLTVPLGFMAFLGTRLLLEMWNNLDDDRRAVEQSLPPHKRQVAHVVTGWVIQNEQTGRGEMIVVYFTGDPLADALTFVGQSGTLPRVSDMLDGRISLSRGAREQLEALVSEPGQKAVGLLTPVAKVPLEIKTNRSSLTGQPIVPRELEGTSEAKWRYLRHGAESFFRPLREARTLGEQAGKREGIDWLSHRFGLGLPFERVDPQEARARGALQQWHEARLEYVESALAALRDSADFTKLPPHQQEIMLRQVAQMASTDFARRVPSPYTRRERLGRRLRE